LRNWEKKSNQKTVKILIFMRYRQKK